MIVDKKSLVESTEEEVTTTSSSSSSSSNLTDEDLWIKERVESNAMYDAYMAVREMLESIRVDPDDDNSPPLFKTIKLDTGQLSRIKHNEYNKQYSFALPAVFIRFIDIYYNQGAAGIQEGRGTMRIHYVLNRLNNEDDGIDCEGEGLKVYKRIIDVIESNKYNYDALTHRFQLQYWDMPETFDDGVQPFWIDYQIWFHDYTAYIYKNYVNVYVTHPPFTQPSDQDDQYKDEDTPDKYDEPKFEDCASIEDFSS